ncbi:hypothetical protein AUR64_15020 [Haloprofundus marisrubri]|uniref:Uncharacterized protein n=1 Tax=Haloprofundus marisrubri TaxID=1514971 RepID=A0A0W1R6M6_9EURY|nr:hypothetical protein [Haloprofundus marisrubri]KTG09107.1 hypothetical protein AUR64_15020 [Haloprofundus marisrubri]
MYQTPSPTHGYVPVVVAFWVYLVVAGAVAIGAVELGVSDGGAVLVFLVVAVLLLKPFASVFRRLTPTANHEE